MLQAARLPASLAGAAQGGRGNLQRNPAERQQPRAWAAFRARPMASWSRAAPSAAARSAHRCGPPGCAPELLLPSPGAPPWLSPGCCTARNSVRPSASKQGPHSSHPVGPMAKQRAWPAAAPARGSSQQLLLPNTSRLAQSALPPPFSPPCSYKFCSHESPEGVAQSLAISLAMVLKDWAHLFQFFFVISPFVI